MSEERGLKSRKTSKLRIIFSALSLVAVFPALWYWWSLSPHSKHLGSWRTFSPATISTSFDSSLGADSSEAPLQIYAAGSSGRAVFPYSVIPGGVHSARELVDAVQNDALIAQHYSDFRVGTALVIRLKKDRQAYVSYRLGDRIYWTRNKVQLHAGEMLLSDGKSLARGRCGNRVSDSPKLPVSPKEPPDRTMSMPVFVPDPMPLGFPVGGVPVTATVFPPHNPAPPPSSNGPQGGPFPPFFPPVFPGGRGSPTTPLGPPPPPPIVVTPEPASVLLVFLGLACLGALNVLLRK